jgi:hypothetical protein
MSCQIALAGIGIVAPGLNGWEGSAPILAGEARYRPGGPLPPPGPGLLGPTLRRRTTATTRLALAAGEQAVAHSGLPADSVCTLFSSSDGDMEVADALCRGLATPDHLVSPTRFHNSVHNAPAAYWSIATGSRLPSASIAVYAMSFTSGLLDAAVFVRAEGRETLLVAYDSPAPFPMSVLVPIPSPFAVAMVLAPVGGARELGRVHLEIARERGLDGMPDPGLERLRQGNSAAHCLPLLGAVARGAPQTVVLPYLRNRGLVARFEPRPLGSRP